MKEFLKKHSANIVFLILGGLLSSYFETLRRTLEDGVLNVNSNISRSYYTGIAEFLPQSQLAFVIINVVLCSLIGIVNLLFIHQISIYDDTILPTPERRLSRAFDITSILAALYLFINMYIYFSKANQYGRFEKKISAIEPFVADKEIKTLKSQWVFMRTKSDYDSINNKIDYYFKINKLQKLN